MANVPLDGRNPQSEVWKVSEAGRCDRRHYIVYRRAATKVDAITTGEISQSPRPRQHEQRTDPTIYPRKAKPKEATK